MRLEGPDACLAFLIEHQKEWQPDIWVYSKVQGGKNIVPVTLVGVANALPRV